MTRKIIAPLIIAPLLLASCACPPPKQKSSAMETNVVALYQCLDAANSVILQSAQAFFDSKNAGNHVTILTLRQPHEDALTVVEYKSGLFTVVSLPVMPEAQFGWCAFVKRFNEFVLVRADLYALNHNPGRALEIYRLLMHFDSCGSLTSDIVPRLSLASNLLHGVNANANEEHLGKLVMPYLPSILGSACDKLTISTNDLMIIKVDKFTPSVR